MTDAQIRLAIAELVAKQNGWTVDKRKSTTGKDMFAFISGKDTLKGFAPNWLNDISAAIALEDELAENERKTYVIALYEITNEARPWSSDSSPYPAQFWFVHATARQRCEAWLKAMGIEIEEGG